MDIVKQTDSRMVAGQMERQQYLLVQMVAMGHYILKKFFKA